MNQINFLIAGSPKTGTTSLANFISKMDDFFVPINKEAHIFDKATNVEECLNLEKVKYSKVKGESFVVDATPNYILFPQVVADCFNKDKAKKTLYVVFVLRDPFRRLLSHINHNLTRSINKFDVNELITKEISNYEKGLQTEYIDYGLYYKWLEQWKKLLPNAQFLYLFTDELMNEAVIKNKLSDFVGVSHEDMNVLMAKDNAGGEVKSKFLMKVILGDSNLKKMLRKLIKPEYRDLIRNKVISVNLNKSKIHEINLNPELELKIKSIYKADTLKLSEFLSRNISWELN